MNSINKNLAFPPSLHWVVLIGKTTPLNFIQDFGFRNTNIRYLTPQSIISTRDIIEPVDCFSVEVSADLPKHTLKNLMADLKKLAIEKHCPVFCFSRDTRDGHPCIEPDLYTILVYNEQVKGGVICRSQGHPIGPFTLDPLSNALEEILKAPPSDDSVNDKTPPRKTAKTTIKISDLLKTRGFHRLAISPQTADAIVRQQKKDIVLSAERSVQKGDYIVFMVGECTSYQINSMVFEVSFVSAIPHSTLSNGYSQVSISLNRLPNAEYHEGDIGGDFFCDTIVFDETRKD